jgi:hypothetical protein
MRRVEDTMRRDVWVLVWLWCVGYVLWPVRFAKRWYLRLKLRRKMRHLGMIPERPMTEWVRARLASRPKVSELAPTVKREGSHKILLTIPLVAVLWATLEVHALAAQSTDSVYTMPWVTDSIGEQGARVAAVYCIDRAADWGSLVVVGKLTRLVPDTVTTPTPCNGAPIFWDFPVCPTYAPPVGASPFVLLRCEHRWYRFPLRRPVGARSS